MDDMDRAMIRLLAKHSLNVSDVAREICYHRNSVVYRIQRIKKKRRAKTRCSSTT